MNFQSFSQKIREHGFAVEAEFLSSAEVDLILEDFENLRSQERFRQAGIGRGELHQLRSEVRRDQICWLEFNTENQARLLLRKKLDKVQDDLNQQLFLGLFEFEGHYAFYGPGAFYEKHIDRFEGTDLRVLSFVLYLNKNWKPQDGGELKIFSKISPSVLETVLPHAGTLVCFLSDETPHEVLITQRERRSFTGWFKRRDLRS